MVAFPRRYAEIINYIDRSSPLYSKVFKAFHMGLIPEDGLKTLIRLSKEHQYVK